MVLTDGSGVPITGMTASAGLSEVRLALPTVDSFAVPVRPLHPIKHVRKIIADKGYDAAWLRAAFRERHITPYIPKRRKPGEKEEPKYNKRIKDQYTTRWVVERTIAWLGWNRRLLVRWERKHTTYQAFFNIACLMICLREVLK
jgi:transposase